MNLKTLSILLTLLSGSITTLANAQYYEIESPEGTTTVYVGSTQGVAWYSIVHGNSISTPAATLGLKTDRCDYSKLTLTDIRKDEIGESYVLERSKHSNVTCLYNVGICTFKNDEGKAIEVEFRVSENDIAFRYRIPKDGEAASAKIMDELTEFSFSDTYDNSYISTFLTPQSDPTSGWKHTKPSYEEPYGIGEKIGQGLSYNRGYTFPCLFKLGSDGWMLISETGVNGGYCGSRLGEPKLMYKDEQNTENPEDDMLYYGYKLEYAMPGENNGIGTATPYIPLPGTTPWRTITIGETLQPIVETTVIWDHVEPQYTSAYTYETGKSTWSWILWQDASINMTDQKAYIDLASAMGFKYVLIDNLWDQNMGRDGIAELVEYGAERGVGLFLWYNSNGCWNDTYQQSPTSLMSSTVARKKEMKWMQEIGVKGIKVDFFGGDKQETMGLYEAILSDADDCGIMVIFHGCTIPRGWERMYPNFMGSEGVRSSETFLFGQEDCNLEATMATLYPFTRNTIGSMEFGGCILNKRLDRTNSKGNIRSTTDVFQLATCVLYQNPIQNFALAPNNLQDAPAACLDFVREVPVTWDETRLIEGYPGEYIIMARRKGDLWYVAAANAGSDQIEFCVWDLIYDLRELCGKDSWNPAKDSEVLIYNSAVEGNLQKVPFSDMYKTKVRFGHNDGTVIIFRTDNKGTK